MKTNIKQTRRARKLTLAAIARSYGVTLLVFTAFLLFLCVLVIAERFLIGLA
jgi:hypothetical protein